jgi:hypothetical protein
VVNTSSYYEKGVLYVRERPFAVIDLITIKSWFPLVELKLRSTNPRLNYFRG